MGLLNKDSQTSAYALGGAIQAVLLVVQSIIAVLILEPIRPGVLVVSIAIGCLVGMFAIIQDSADVRLHPGGRVRRTLSRDLKLMLPWTLMSLLFGFAMIGPSVTGSRNALIARISEVTTEGALPAMMVTTVVVLAGTLTWLRARSVFDNGEAAADVGRRPS
jgi:hypothetical protein